MPNQTHKPMKLNRRHFLGGAAAATAGFGMARAATAQNARQTDTRSTAELMQQHSRRWKSLRDQDLRPAVAGEDYAPITVPNGHIVDHKIRGGVKVFHLVASEFEHEFAKGLTAKVWGYNGVPNAATIEAVEGDTVRIYVTNNLPTVTTVHWHGFILPMGMDGVSGLSQPAIPVGETWVYEFKLVQHGTYMFHSHHDTMTQEGMGLTGLFIVHPRHRPRNNEDGNQDGQENSDEDPAYHVDRDFAIMLHEWRIDAGTSRPNPNEMSDFNILTMNGKVLPDTDPLVCATDQHVRIRLANLSAMDHHPIHLHGHEFYETAVDGYDIPPAHQQRKVTTLVGVGQTRTIEFIADNPGDWPMHCHMTHHVMNQMGHDFPNMVGVDDQGFDENAKTLIPGYMTMGTQGMGDMGGMSGGMEDKAGDGEKGNGHMRHGSGTGHGNMDHGKMAMPPNSIPMKKGQGPHGTIMLGGMATILKVRDNLVSYEDPGWYERPDGTAVQKATADQIRRDGIGN